MVKNCDELSGKSLSEKVQEISSLYFLALRRVREGECVSDSGSVAHDDQQFFIYRVRFAFHSLEDAEKIIINNEFFYNAYPGWWKEAFTRSTFYRLKKRCMLHFLEAFESE